MYKKILLSDVMLNWLYMYDVTVNVPRHKSEKLFCWFSKFNETLNPDIPLYMYIEKVIDPLLNICFFFNYLNINFFWFIIHICFVTLTQCGMIKINCLLSIIFLLLKINILRKMHANEDFMRKVHCNTHWIALGLLSNLKLGQDTATVR